MKIFLVIVFACFVTVSSVLFAGAKTVVGRSMADASLQLAGRSVLAEYDDRILSDYGLLAFRGDEAWIEDAIVYYTEASFENTHVEDIEANMAGYSLLNADTFEDQIRSAALAEVLKSVAGSGRKGGSAKGEVSRDDGYGRVLRDTGVISSLPSGGFRSPLIPQLGAVTDIPKLDDLMDAGTALFAVSEYALSVFGNHVDGSVEEHFFGNEVEYLIAGKKDDADNYRSVKNELRLFRYGMNYLALSSDSNKMAKVEELTAAIVAISSETPYEGVKAAIMAAWTGAETGNDMKLLEQGDKVALIKTKSQWATHGIVQIADGWVAEITLKDPVYPKNRGGLKYRDYLRLMLYIMDRETKLLRIMDLIQINLKGTYYGDFLIREHYVGFQFKCNVDGEGYDYTEKY